MRRILLGLALVAAAIVAAPAANAQFTLVKSVVGNGGSTMSNGSLTMNGTVGQAAIGFVTSASFTHGIGFWYPSLVTGSVDATPGYASNGNTLYQNFPNPFRGSTVIRFTLAHSADVVLKVFSTPGEEVATLANGEFESGDHEVTLTQQLASGTYFYQLQIGSSVLRRQMVVAR